jgi:hypothetical protein
MVRLKHLVTFFVLVFFYSNLFAQAISEPTQLPAAQYKTGFISIFIGESGKFAVPWAIFLVVLILILIFAFIIGGNKLKKILRNEGLQITLNDYWVSSDNNGLLLKSKDGMDLRLAGIKIPIAIEKEKDGLIKIYKLTQKEVIETRNMQKTINGFKWDMLMFNLAQTGIELHAYTTLNKSGIKAIVNLRQHDFDTLAIDYDSMFSFLHKQA